MRYVRGVSDLLISHYENIVNEYDWAMSGVPLTIGTWYLLVGLGPSSVEYPSKLSGIYVDQHNSDFIYLELTEEEIVKIVVAKSVELLLPDIPERTLQAVNIGLGRPPSPRSGVCSV